MPLSPQMFHCPVRIIGDSFDLGLGETVRKPIGTGFCVRVPSETIEGKFHNYVITAHHVVKTEVKVELEIADPYNPGTLFPRVEAPSAWIQPIPDYDLAVAEFPPPAGYIVTALELDHHLIERLPSAPLLGMVFYYVGLFAPYDRPLARSGTIAATDQDRLEGERGYSNPVHLVDCRSYGGFSGSPCFVEYPFPTLTEQLSPIPPPEGVGPLGRIVYAHLLCGMFLLHLDSQAEDQAVSVYGVGKILPSNELWRALMTDELRGARLRRDDGE